MDPDASAEIVLVSVNYRESTSAIAARARAIVRSIAGDGKRVAVWARSRGGRWIEKWEDAKRLTDPRVTRHPINSPIGRHFQPYGSSEADAAARVERLQSILPV